MKYGILAAVGLSLFGCAGATGPKVHFATATEAQIKMSSEQAVWYEFREGDDVPIAMLYNGVVEAKIPARLKAKKRFWLVVEPHRPVRFSFDGNSIWYESGKAGLAVGTAEGTNFVGMMVYVGDPKDAPDELKH